MFIILLINNKNKNIFILIDYLDDVPNAVTKAGPSLTIILYGD